MTQYGGGASGYEGGGGNELTEKVVHIRRVAKVVKGGRHLSFNAMVIVGDGRGRVGIGLGKGPAVPDAVRKGNSIARKQLIPIPMRGSTIPHMVRAHYGASQVIIKPAPAGAGIVAGGAVRAVMEAAGIQDVVAKALGSRNPINVVKATLEGLQLLQGELSREQLMAPSAQMPAPRRDFGARPRPRRDDRPRGAASIRPAVAPAADDSAAVPDAPAADASAAAPDAPAADASTAAPDAPAADASTPAPDAPAADASTEAPDAPAADASATPQVSADAEESKDA